MDRLSHWITASFQPRSLEASVSLPCESEELAKKYLHNPYLLTAMNALIDESQPTAKSMRNAEQNLQVPDLFTIEKTEEGFLKARYRRVYPFAGPPSALQDFCAIAKDISLSVVEVRTTGPKSLIMVETYTITDAHSVEKTVVLENYNRVRQRNLEYGLEWNKRVWEKGLDGTQ